MKEKKYFTCSICKKSDYFPVYEVKERMLGTLAPFDYSSCSFCGTLELMTPPKDISEYYPDNYYSYKKIEPKDFDKHTMANFARRLLITHRLGSFSLIGSVVSSLYPNYMSWIIKDYFNLNNSILDIGCGAGAFLIAMANAGFSNLHGIDLYNNENIHYKNGVSILKKDLFQETKKYKTIMLHHSFEHMDNPELTLNHLRKCLDDDGTILIRVPIADSYAWKEYQENWVQIDSPRHYFLHTVSGMKILTERCGLRIDKIIYDSFSLQYWGSELYKAGKTLKEGPSQFPGHQIKKWDLQAANNNNNQDGDQACFYIKLI